MALITLREISRECMCRSAKVKTVLAGGGMNDASLNESAIKRVMKKQGYSIQNLRHLLSVVSVLR